ncbi:MAG: UxaA family hydrolase [Ruminococcaceae bacterium]|nr:UxaA family hydrolase [Oscillospiraceae bacterium]
MATPKYIHINDKDNAVIALAGLKKGEVLEVDGEAITARDDIPQSHKMAIADIPEGAPVIKYGEEIGKAGTDIKKGDWVHAHNIAGSTNLQKVVDDRFAQNTGKGAAK